MSKKNQRKYTAKFRHYRSLGVRVGLNGEYYEYIDSRGGATLAYRKDENEGGIVGAVAYCNPTDNYKKSYGRDKAEGLLNQSKDVYDLEEVCASTGLPRFFIVEGDDEKAFLALVDEEMNMEAGYEPR